VGLHAQNTQVQDLSGCTAGFSACELHPLPLTKLEFSEYGEF